MLPSKLRKAGQATVVSTMKIKDVDGVNKERSLSSANEVPAESTGEGMVGITVGVKQSLMNAYSSITSEATVMLPCGTDTESVKQTGAKSTTLAYEMMEINAKELMRRLTEEIKKPPLHPDKLDYSAR